jgi:hypothetical protein
MSQTELHVDDILAAQARISKLGLSPSPLVRLHLQGAEAKQACLLDCIRALS